MNQNIGILTKPNKFTKIGHVMMRRRDQLVIGEVDDGPAAGIDPRTTQNLTVIFGGMT